MARPRGKKYPLMHSVQGDWLAIFSLDNGMRRVCHCQKCSVCLSLIQLIRDSALDHWELGRLLIDIL